MQETRTMRVTKSNQLIFYYKEFKFRKNSIVSNEINQSTNINEKLANEDNFNEELTSFDLMDFLSNTSITVESTQYQMNKQIDVYQNKKKQEWVRIFQMNILSLFSNFI